MRRYGVVPTRNGSLNPKQLNCSCDRFDLVENRAIGRAYLSLLYRRYGNWSDVVTAYNWGMGNVDAWIRSGRQSEKLLPAVASYLHRVLNDSGICRSSPKPVQDCIEPFARNDRRATRYPDLMLPGLRQSGRSLPILSYCRILVMARGFRRRRFGISRTS